MLAPVFSILTHPLSQLRPEEQLAWLKRVTHNKLIDAYRKAQHRRNVNIDIFAEVLYDNDEKEI